MNDKQLKELLNEAYGSEQPDNKYYFTQQIKRDPAWRKLHPISSFFGLYPFAKTAIASFCAAAVGTGIIAYSFNSDRAPKPPVEPPVIIAVTTEPAETGVKGTSATMAHQTIVSTRTTAAKTEPLSSDTLKPDTTTSNNSTKTTAAQTQHTVPTTTAAFTNEAAVTTSTKVYRTEIFPHDYTFREAQVSDSVLIDLNTKLYGYPGQVFWESMSETPFKQTDMIDDLFVFGMPSAVEGDIVGLEYTLHEDKPWTICSVKLSNVYHFEIGEESEPIVLNSGDIIQIAEPGGWMSLREYMTVCPDKIAPDEFDKSAIDSSFIYEAGSNENEPHIGERYLYILDDDMITIDGKEYFLRQSYCDIFQFTRTGDIFKSCNSGFTAELPESRLISAMPERRIINDPDSSRSIMFRDDSSLIFGFVSCFAADSSGHLTYLDRIDASIGLDPLGKDDYEEYRDSDGRPVIRTGNITVTWTESGFELVYNSFFTIRRNYDYPV